MEFIQIILILAIPILSEADNSNDKPPLLPTITRTELKVARSLNTEDTQTLNVMTKDGGVTQLIVKRRDGKSKNNNYDNLQNLQINKNDNSHQTVSRAIYTNWLPFPTSVYYQPNIIRLDTIALTRNSTNNPAKPIRQDNLGNFIDSDRIPHVPKPITIRSSDVYVKNFDKKRARSVMQLDTDGIPIIHGVRVPDDETDSKQIWRNARVINGKLIPYEKDYKPPAAIQLGELIYANNNNEKDLETEVGKEAVKDSNDYGGPFTREDNYNKNEQTGPFTVKDDNYVKFANSQSNGNIGPFTKADNAKLASSKLIDYIKEINEKESKRDYFSRNRKYRSYSDENQSQMQRRMLQYSSQHTSYPNSLLYTPTNSKLSPVTFNEGVRTPVLQYAHPELGVQPAKATSDDEQQYSYSNGQNLHHQSYSTNSDYDDNGRHSQFYDNTVNNDVNYYRKDIINYPYNTYYIKPKPEQPFWIRITESIRDNVQNGFERMQQLTRPVFEPIVEATHKISHNLGFSQTTTPKQAQNKVGFIATAPIGTSVILPALGLVAGGAALGFGAAAVGRFLTPEIDMRGFQPNNDIVVIMAEPNTRPQFNQVSGDNNGDDKDSSHKRFRRNIVDSDDEYLMQKLYQNDGIIVDNHHKKILMAPEFWTDTPCSKKLFCNVMLYENQDEIILMEKKMDSLISRVHPDVANSVSQHLQDVMDAVKMRDCSKFICSRRFPFLAPAA